VKETLGGKRDDRYSPHAASWNAHRHKPHNYARRVRREAQIRTHGRRDDRLQEGFANVAQAITAPGDVVLCPNTKLSIHAFGVLIGGRVSARLQ